MKREESSVVELKDQLEEKPQVENDMAKLIKKLENLCEECKVRVDILEQKIEMTERGVIMLLKEFVEMVKK